MMEIGRRSFLFGLGAAVATAALARPMAIIMPPPPMFKMRRICTVTLCADPASREPMFMEMMIGENRRVLNAAIGPGGYYTWRPIYQEDWIIQSEHEALRLDLRGNGNLGEAQLIAYNEEGVGILECHKMTGKPPELVYLEASADRVSA